MAVTVAGAGRLSFDVIGRRLLEMTIRPPAKPLFIVRLSDSVGLDLRASSKWRRGTARGGDRLDLGGFGQGRLPK